MKTKNIQYQSAGRFSAAVMVFLLLAGLPAALAEDKDNLALQDCSTKIDAAVKTQDETKITAEIAGKFTTLAGSEANATALVTGLHAGTSITLTSTVDGEIVTTTITPTTGQQGFGSVYITLALAQAELTKMGIANPTASQLEAVLNGGSITTTTGTVSVAGILALRASGQGWGQIAQTLDVKLGRVLHETHAACERFEHQARSDMAKHDRPTKVDRAVDKVERISARPERPLDRVERVSVVDRPVRVDLPMRPERARH